METQVNTFSIKRKKFFRYLKRYWPLYALLLIPMVYFIVFKYGPMEYIQIAFKKYVFKRDGVDVTPWQMEWAKNNGMEYFLKAFKDRDFWNAVRNTLTLNILDLLFGFPAPIILALILNELAFKRFKRVTQTIVYMPHFLSWIIISGLALQLFNPTDGLINVALNKIGLDTVPFLNSPTHWIGTYIFLGIWQSVGWNTIIYLAAITGINPELYEAASVDGAGRLRKIWNITLPGIRSTIVVLLIMSLGRILGSEFDRPYALGNNIVKGVSDVIATFVYTRGIRSLQYSLATAVGLFQSVIGVIFLFTANAIAKRFGERGVW